MQTTHNRIFGLDILRAIAILTVVYMHAQYIIPDRVDHFLYNCFVIDGVSIFFVLSGFLIGGILLKTISNTGLKTGDLTNFWIRRWFRTLPAYFVVLTALIIQNMIGGEKMSFSQYGSYFIFTQSLIDGSPTLFPDSWSLCVEEWFYLSLPLLLFVSFRFSRFKKQHIILFWVCFIIFFGTVLRIITINNSSYSNWLDWDRYIRKATFIRMDSIMFGVLGAYLNFYKVPIWNKYRNLYLIIGITLLALLNLIYFLQGGFSTDMLYVRFTIESFATLLLIPKLLTLKGGNGLFGKMIGFVSLTSYSIYLINYTPFKKIILPRLGSVIPNEPTLTYDLLRLGAFFAFCFGGAYLLYLCVERPGMRLRELFSKSEHREVIKQEAQSKSIPMVRKLKLMLKKPTA